MFKSDIPPWPPVNLNPSRPKSAKTCSSSNISNALAWELHSRQPPKQLRQSSQALPIPSLSITGLVRYYLCVLPKSVLYVFIGAAGYIVFSSLVEKVYLDQDTDSRRITNSGDQEEKLLFKVFGCTLVMRKETEVFESETGNKIQTILQRRPPLYNIF
ncbi:hypothetical protein GQ43DRAFT_138212 [Delitschia confertaspora ATCC 74209]|uniref:Uncharacterized protein n=1 Tax=Delitschia confertaspora ATCC 74209 TaxID=1513339 RepID=A0A9P4MTC1_9PLEO|nr:hypothetical protein GQ43DRAFT_138212 [Delitschia confertaspora ATCC 74209]